MGDIAAGTITTIAGQLAQPGKYGDGGPALQATLSNPMYIALHHARNKLYFSDHYNHVVREIDLIVGNVTTVAGTIGLFGNVGPTVHAVGDTFASRKDGQSLKSPLTLPTGLALDQAKNMLYIGDSSNFAVRAVDLTSGVTSEFVLRTLSSRAGYMGTHGD